MTRERSLSIWSLLLIACLFLLGVLVPRAWERKANSRPHPVSPHQARLAREAASRQARSQTPPLQRATGIVAERRQDQPVGSIAEAGDDEVMDLGAFAKPREMAAVAGPVSNRAPVNIYQPQIFPQSTTTLERRVAPQATFSITSIGRWERPKRDSQRMAALTTDQVKKEVLARIWPEPSNLVAQLDCVAQIPVCADWATDVLDRLLDLCGHESIGSSRSTALLVELQELANSTPHQAVKGDERISLSRAAYGLQRRIEIWMALQRLTALDPITQLSSDLGKSNRAVFCSGTSSATEAEWSANSPELAKLLAVGATGTNRHKQLQQFAAAKSDRSANSRQD